MRLPIFLTCFLILSSGIAHTDIHAGDPRVPWTASRLQGSPEPPPPFALERAFPHEFVGPISINRMPDSSTFLVLEQGGKIYAFDALKPEEAPRLVIDFNQTPPPHSQPTAGPKRNVQLFSIAFHPEFANNRFAFICYITTGGGSPTDTHIARFVMPAGDEPQIQVASEQSVLVCEGGGHNGCTLLFGPDGYMYISIGDLEVPTPPDPRNTGQDISDLYASILRIDVDATTTEQNYGIPPDNPFVHLASARPEVFAYGLRNPFRMAFDDLTGDLWVGDVGWEAWEMVYRVRPGGNYGWAIKEGPGDVKPQTPGPTPILPPDVALGHSEAASVTGGMVYRGDKYPQLSGKYIFGDWITRKFWATSFDSERVLGTQEIATSNVKPICFETDQDGELLILEYSEANQAGAIYRLIPNPDSGGGTAEFPRRLSETGLFSDTEERIPSSGVAPYQINAPMWADGATAEYLLAIPGVERASFYQRPQKTFNWFRTKVTMPLGSVLAKTYRLGQTPVETQLSVKDEKGEWQYYTYRWNEASDDAELVDASGGQAEFTFVSDQGEQLTRSWDFAARASCRICHTPWTGETVGFIEPQLRQGHAGDSWNVLRELGLIQVDEQSLNDSKYSALVNPHSPMESISSRARSYLHTNCAHCHMNGGNASTVFGLNFDLSLEDAKMVDVQPMRGDLGLSQANIVAAGDPQRSVLLYRMAKAGSGHMPHVGSHQVDPQGLRLIRLWIAQLSSDAQQRNWLDTICAPRLKRGDDKARLAAAEQLLESASGAMLLSAALADRAVPQDIATSIVDAAMQRPSNISELFEAFASEDQLPQRLGDRFDANDVLKLAGNAERGEQLFAGGTGSCANCHRVGNVGKELGPEFGVSAARYKTPEKLLEQIIQPSLNIDEKYRAVSVLTTRGTVLVGRVVSENDEALTILDQEGKNQTIARDDIGAIKPSPVSMMPEQLLSQLTAQQAADLLAYIMSLGANGE